MRPALRAFAALAAIALWPQAAGAALAVAAAVLVEAAPLLLVAALAAPLLRAAPNSIAYAGCGCSPGPAARSLPAAALTWVAFGPPIALARFAAAALVDRLRRQPPAACAHSAPIDAAAELERLLPYAIAAGAGSQIAARIDLSHAGVAAQLAAGAVLGALASPCAIGAVALASALRVHTPFAAAAFLGVAGIADFNALRGARRSTIPAGDATAYGLLAAALAAIAYKSGDALVRPALTPVLAICAAAAAALAIARRKIPARRAHLAPLLVLVAAFTAMPPPVFRATETTLTDAFAGERLSFTGVLTRDRDSYALVRYAMTCCRADAAPVAVRLARPVRADEGVWLRADGTIVETPRGLALAPGRVTPVAPPPDPFLYR